MRRLAFSTLGCLLYGHLLAARILHHGTVGLDKTVAAALLGGVTIFLGARRFDRVRLEAWGVAAGLVLLGLPAAAALRTAAATVMSPWAVVAAWLLAVCLSTFRLAPRVAGSALVLLAVMGTVGLLDLLHGLREDDVRAGSIPEPFLMRDESMGHAPVPNFDGRAFRRVGRSLCYDVKVTTDAFSRRITPYSVTDSPFRHAVFMGCSFVFGEGVNDWETLPAWFGALTSGCRTFNYGVSGYGPQHMLQKLQSGSLPSEIPASRGILVYCLQPFHVDRAIGSYIFLKWGRFSPRYVLVGGRPVHTGSFVESSGAWVRMVDLLKASPTADRVAARLDLWLSYARALGYREAIPLTVAIVAESARLYRQQFDGRLVVVIWPSHDDRSRDLEAGLAALSVPVINLLREGLEVPGVDGTVPLDGHPNGAYYLRTAILLRRLLAPYLGVNPDETAPH